MDEKRTEKVENLYRTDDDNHAENESGTDGEVGAGKEGSRLNHIDREPAWSASSMRAGLAMESQMATMGGWVQRHTSDT